MATDFGKGYLAGMAAWIAYATVEFIAYSIVPLLQNSEMQVNPTFWRAEFVTIAVYVLAGGLLGGLAAAWGGRLGKGAAHRIPIAATLPLLIVSIANQLFQWPLTSGEAISATLALALTGLGLCCMRSEAWRERAGFLMGPLAVSSFLLLPVWIGSYLLRYRSSTVRVFAIFGSVIATAAICWMWRRVRGPGRMATPKYAAAMVLAFGCVCLAGAIVSPGLPKLPARNMAQASKARPNVVLVVMDTVRADHTSLHGYGRDTTPFLRELANEATVYEHALAVSDMSLPTHASMFTGLHPRTHGAHYDLPKFPWGRPLDKRFGTMAELLRANGYRTMGVVANHAYLSPSMGFDEGFEAYDWRRPLSTENKARPHSHFADTVTQITKAYPSLSTHGLVVRDAGEITNAAAGMLDQTGKNQPYFLFLNYMDAHNPNRPPEPFRSAFPCSDPRMKSSFSDAFYDTFFAVLRGSHEVTPQERQCLEGQYDAGIMYLDTQLRELVAKLKRRGDFENTLLVITSDHGDAFGERNMLSHGGVSVYQEEIGIPLLIRYPRTGSPARVETYVDQMDLLPTVLDVAGIPQNEKLQGTSLRDSQAYKTRPIISICYPAGFAVSNNPSLRRIEEALLMDRAKLVISTAGKRERFDLAADPTEEHNLYREGDSHFNSLMAVLNKWKASVPAAANSDSPRGGTKELDRLKSLGYVQ